MTRITKWVLTLMIAVGCVPACGGDDPQCKVDTDCSPDGRFVCVASECKVAPTPSR